METNVFSTYPGVYPDTKMEAKDNLQKSILSFH